MSERCIQEEPVRKVKYCSLIRDGFQPLGSVCRLPLRKTYSTSAKPLRVFWKLA